MVCRLGSDIRRWQKIIIDEATWQGEDIFIARGLPGTLITSDRFKKFCEDNDISNAILVPADKHNRDFYPSDKKPT